jgi:hypothetical protein
VRINLAEGRVLVRGKTAVPNRPWRMSVTFSALKKRLYLPKLFSSNAPITRKCLV